MTKEEFDDMVTEALAERTAEERPTPLSLASRPLLVGEDNPLSPDPAHALFPHPRGCAGWRLCFKVLALAPVEYFALYDRANLCDGEWDTARARIKARAILASHSGGPIVALGSKAARAFGLGYEPFTVRRVEDRTVVVLPHPSGRCRGWNDAGSFERARRVLRSVGAR